MEPSRSPRAAPGPAGAVPPIRAELLAAIERVCDSQRFILGPEVEALEAELAQVLESPHAITVSSGTDALLAAMMALGIGPGDEVVTTTYSFFATAGCVSRLGATPVFVDILPDTYNLDPDAVRAAITPRTRGGHCGPLVWPLCRHGPAARRDRRSGHPAHRRRGTGDRRALQGRQAGSMGPIGCFSFFPSKNLGAFGDGGLVTCVDAALAHEVALLETTAPSRSICTSGSAGISGSTRCRRQSCG